MTDRILIRCPLCQHELRVRSEYAGRKLVCNFCRETFVAHHLEGPDATNGSDVAAPRNHLRTPSIPSEELARAQAKIMQLRGQRQALAEEVLKAKNILGPLRLRVKDLQDQLDQARMQTALAEEEMRASASSLTELDRLRVEIATLAPRAAESVRLEERLGEAGQENERLRREIEDAGAVLSRGGGPDLDAALPERCARLLEELSSLRGALEHQAAANEGHVARLKSERDETARQRDRLEAELASLRAGFQEARDEINRMGHGLEDLAAEGARLEEERAEVSRMRDELHSLVEEQRRSLSEQESELAGLRDRLELERSELESRFGRDLRGLAAELADARSDIARLRKQHDHERESWSSRLDTAGENAVREAETARTEVESLKDVLQTLHQSVAELQSERDRLASLREQDRQRASQVEEHQKAEIRRLMDERTDVLAQLELKTRQLGEVARRVQTLQDEGAHATSMQASSSALPPRPGVRQDEDPATFRARLEAWLEAAGEALRTANEQAEALGAEVKAARDELDILTMDLALGAWDEDEEEIAFPFDES